MRTRDCVTLWVCVDCYFTHHYGTPSDDPDYVPDRTPLGMIGEDEGQLVAGLAAEEHECGFERGDRTAWESGDCNCEHVDFSWSICDGCGSPLGGTRDALTLFLEEK